jgi:hypothetical protein
MHMDYQVYDPLLLYSAPSLSAIRLICWICIQHFRAIVERYQLHRPRCFLLGQGTCLALRTRMRDMPLKLRVGLEEHLTNGILVWGRKTAGKWRHILRSQFFAILEPGGKSLCHD